MKQLSGSQWVTNKTNLLQRSCYVLKTKFYCLPVPNTMVYPLHGIDKE